MKCRIPGSGYPHVSCAFGQNAYWFLEGSEVERKTPVRDGSTQEEYSGGEG